MYLYDHIALAWNHFFEMHINLPIPTSSISKNKNHPSPAWVCFRHVIQLVQSHAPNHVERIQSQKRFCWNNQIIYCTVQLFPRTLPPDSNHSLLQWHLTAPPTSPCWDSTAWPSSTPDETITETTRPSAHAADDPRKVGGCGGGCWAEKENFRKSSERMSFRFWPGDGSNKWMARWI